MIKRIIIGLLKSQYLICRRNKKFCLRVCRYKTARFRGYFLGARDVLVIFLICTRDGVQKGELGGKFRFFYAVQ